MILSPHSLLELINDGRLIRNLSARELENPEGVGFDLRLKNVSVLSGGRGSLKVSTRRTPNSVMVGAGVDRCFTLDPGKTYLVSTMEEFDLPEGLAAFFFPRSTLLEAGCRLAPAYCRLDMSVL